MTRQMSYSKLKNEMMHGFRERMHQAESTEDVKKFYANTMCRFFDRLVGDGKQTHPDDVTLNPDSDAGYDMASDLTDRAAFQSAWNDSDLPQIVDDFTRMALHRHARLSKNAEKTRSKIHHTDGKR